MFETPLPENHNTQGNQLSIISNQYPVKPVVSCHEVAAVADYLITDHCELCPRYSPLDTLHLPLASVY